MPKHELLNKQRCLQHGYRFPCMNYSLHVPLEETARTERGGEQGNVVGKQAEEETDADEKGSNGGKRWSRM